MQASLPRTFLAHLLLALALGACAKDTVDVEFVQMIAPAAGYGELKRLAVGIDPYLDTELRELLLNSLKKCPIYSEIIPMDKPVKVSGTNPKDYFDALVKNSELAQSTQGVLSLQLEDNTQSSTVDKQQAYVFDDKSTFDWAGSSGLPFAGTFGLPQQPELALARKLKRRDTVVRSDRSQFIVRLVLYNRVSGSIVQDKLISSQSSLHNYSRKPGIRKASFFKMIERSVIDEAIFYACPAKEQVTRKLYYGLDETNTLNQTINEGMDLVDEDRWAIAASKWSSVLLKDPKQALAHHNLAVHYERQGELMKAIEHYKSAALSPQKPLIAENVYEEMLKIFRPKIGILPLYPQVAFVSGSGWAYIRAENSPLRDKKLVSLYRIEPAFSQDISRSLGISLREVGTLRLHTSSDGYFSGRVREHLLDYPVKPGDFMIGE